MSKMNSYSLDLMRDIRELRKPKQITLCGLLVALYVVTYYTNIPLTQVIQIRFGFLVLATAGFIGGPIMGGTVGLLGDLLSVIVTGQGAMYFPGFTFNYVLMGVLFGFLFYNRKVTVLRAIVGGFTEFFIAMIFNTLWLGMLYHNPYEALFISRLPKNVIMLVINTILLFVFLNTLGVALKKSRILDN